MVRSESILRLTLFGWMCIVLNVAYSQIVDPFSIRHQVNQKGGIVMLANVSVSCNNCSAVNEVPPGGFGDNNSNNMVFVDTDTDNSTFQSSSDKLALANCSEITWAGLYWTGKVISNTSGIPNYNSRNQVKLKVNNGAYQTLTADDLLDNTTGKNSYHCFKDITSIVQASPIDARYTVANIVAEQNFNSFGGWVIVIVYKNVYESMRNLTVFDGLSNVTSFNGNVDIPISGFSTPPAGPVNFELGVVAHDGDRSQTGDQLRFNGAGTFVNISDAIHPVNDVFNSTIARNGVVTPLRIPSLNNNLGHDANIFSPNNASMNYIGNNATNATIRISTNSETILTSVVTSAIDIYEPDLRASVTYQDLNGGTVEPGDVLEYTIVSKNIGSDVSLGTILTDTLDQRLQYIPGTISITSGPNAGAKTDAIDTDQAEFIAADNVIRARIGTGANGTTGGQVVNSPTGADSTVLKFQVTLLDDCLVWQCGPTLENKAYLFGTGQISGITNGNGGTSDLLDANNCPSAESGIVTVNTGNCPDTVITYTDSLCVGEDLVMSFPLSPLVVYQWTGPNGFSSTINNPSIPNVNLTHAGDYVLHISLDGEDCISDSVASVFISDNPTIQVNTVQDDSCFNQGSGWIDINGAGNAPFTYTWSNSDNMAVADSLLAGTYSVVVEDVYGCTVSDTFTIDEPTLLTATASITSDYNGQNISCFGASDGSADVTASGGTPPYSYSWSPSGSTTATAASLDTGYHVISVTDTMGCLVKDSVLISQPDTLVATASVTDVLCFGFSTGAIDLSVTGGTTPYTFAWNNAATTEDISNLPTGSYNTTVTDVNGCIDTLSAFVNQPQDSMTITFTQVNVLCHGDQTGEIDVTVTGGNAPYSYAWTNGGTTQDLTSIPSGTYTLTVTDDHGCLQSITVTITQPTAPLALSENHTDILCFGDSTGAIDLTANDGTPGYTYVWDNGPTTQDQTGIPAGSYTCTVTDTNGCVAVQQVTLTQPDSLILSLTQQDVLCYDASTGSIDLTVTGGVTAYTYSWSNGELTEDVSNLPDGFYQVIVTDNHGCVDSISTTITEPQDSMTLTLIKTDILCHGDSTGAIDLTVANGAAPHTFLWNTGATTEDLTGIPSGLYSVSVTDNNGCVQSASITVTQPGLPLTLTETHTNALCIGGVQGTIDLTVSGGTPGYAYNWNNNQTVEDLANLNAGVYSCVVTDTNNCVDSISITITDPDAVVPTETHTDISCFGGADGTIDLSVTGGTPGYTYIWNNGSTLEDQTNLSAGNYFVDVYDVHNCGAFISVLLTEPSAPLSTSDSITHVLCNGFTTGAIDVEVAGGTAPYTYLWSNGDTTQDIQNVGAGAYTLTITDTNNCVLTYTDTILEPAELIMSETHVDILCFGDATGAIDITSNGGVAPYTYSWNTGATTEDINNLIAGTYIVVATDSNNCTDTLQITLIEPLAPLALSDSATHVSCFGGSDGSIDLTVVGGTAPYAYLWTNGSTNEDVNGLPADSYQVTVTDNHGCQDSLARLITQPQAPIALSASMTPVICFGDSTGTMNVVATGGTPGYNYLWSTADTTATVIGVSIGTYQVVVTDTNGCVDSTSIDVTQPTLLVGQISHTDVLCHGDATGSLNTVISGGIPPYMYAWNNGVTTGNNDNVPAGPYEVLVTDSNGCTITLYDTILQPNAPLAVNFSEVNNICFGDSLGTIDATVTGGTTPYSFVWNTGETTEDLDSLAAGMYALTITDTNACVLTDSIEITHPLLITSQNPVITNVSCFEGNDGAIDFTPAGGTPGYTFTWNDLTGAQTEDVGNLTVGTYTVIVKDTNNCTQSFDFDITEPPVLTATYTFVEPLCFGYSDGSLTAVPTGGTPPYAYNWSNGGTQATISNIPAGDYSVTITDSNNCTFLLDCTLGQPDQFDVTFVADSTVGCDPFTVHFTNTSDEQFSCSWDFGDGNTASGCDVSHTYLNADCYDVTLTIQTDIGCENSATYTDYICVNPTPTAALNADPTELFVSMGETNITNLSSGAVSYIWDLGDGTDLQTYYEPGLHTYPDYFLDQYTVTLIAISDQGCADTAKIVIEMDNELIMYIPNAFTPDGDEFNNVFKPVFPAAVSSYDFVIYNRWGQRIFESHDTEIGWDGTYNGNMVQDGTYIWTVKVITKHSAKPVVKQGTVSLLR